MGVEGEHSKPFIPGEAGELDPIRSAGAFLPKQSPSERRHPKYGRSTRQRKVGARQEDFQVSYNHIYLFQAEPALLQLSPSQGKVSRGGPSL